LFRNTEKARALDGTRKEYLESLVTVPLLILDDFGTCKLPLTAAEEVVELIMRRYELASTPVTSNRPVEDWGKLLGDARPPPSPRTRAEVRPAKLASRAVE
jgi:DNA replication protein DnaC